MTDICLYLQDAGAFRSVLPTRDFTQDLSDSLLTSKDSLFSTEIRKKLEKVNRQILDYFKVNPNFSLNLSLTSAVLRDVQRDLSEWKFLSRLSQSKQIEILGQAYGEAEKGGYTVQQFHEQVYKYKQLLKSSLGTTAKVFHSKHLYFTDQMATELAKLDFRGAVSSHSDLANMWQHPNFLYQSQQPQVKLLIQNEYFSDQLTGLLTDANPYQIEEYVCELEDAGEVVNLFIDYNQFLQNPVFWEEFMVAVEMNDQTRFSLASQVLEKQDVVSSVETSGLFPRKFNELIISSPLDAYFSRF